MTGEQIRSLNKRPYRLGRRAEQQSQTRGRIVAATCALYIDIGPGRTTVSEVARRAGVERLTVYRHFPDEAALTSACLAAALAANPRPDPAAWSTLSTPAARLRTALGRIYVHYGSAGELLAAVVHDAPQVAALVGPAEEHQAWLRSVAAGLAAAWPDRVRDRPAVRALLALTLEIQTWRTLRAAGLTDTGAAELMASAVLAAAA